MNILKFLVAQAFLWAAFIVGTIVVGIVTFPNHMPSFVYGAVTIAAVLYAVIVLDYVLGWSASKQTKVEPVADPEMVAAANRFVAAKLAFIAQVNRLVGEVQSAHNAIKHSGQACYCYTVFLPEHGYKIRDGAVFLFPPNSKYGRDRPGYDVCFVSAAITYEIGINNLRVSDRWDVTLDDLEFLTLFLSQQDGAAIVNKAVGLVKEGELLPKRLHPSDRPGIHTEEGCFGIRR